MLKVVKTLHLWPYKITHVQVIEEGDYGRMHFVTSCEQYMTVFFFYQKLTFFTDEAWFHLSGYFSAKNNWYWSSINQRQTCEVPLHDQKIGM
jgi:hypothetical protein